MHKLTSEQDLQSVSGGFGAYDVGHGIGSAARSCLDVFIQMGSMYTAVL